MSGTGQREGAGRFPDGRHGPGSSGGRDLRDARGTRDGRDVRGGQDVWDAGDSQEPRDGRDGGDLDRACDGRDLRVDFRVGDARDGKDGGDAWKGPDSRGFQDAVAPLGSTRVPGARAARSDTDGVRRPAAGGDAVRGPGNGGNGAPRPGPADAVPRPGADGDAVPRPGAAGGAVPRPGADAAALRVPGGAAGSGRGAATGAGAGARATAGAAAEGRPGPAAGAGSGVHVLDNPALASLTGPHARFAERRGRVLRYPVDVSPWLALPDEPAPADWADLAALAGPGAEVPLPGFRGEVPEGWETTFRIEGVQLVDDGLAAAPDAEAVRLGPADVPEILDLIARTRPGPFLPRTVELGTYLGIRRDGALVAMAGERLHPPGWTEISAVCTDPAHRGQGLATRLILAVAHGIRGRGETPFLHTGAENTNAIRLYESLGFRLRRRTAFLAVRTPQRSADGREAVPVG